MPEPTHPRFQIFASTAPGLESITAGELKILGIKGKQDIGGVAFGGDLGVVYEANLWLRTASRVVVRLGRFHASTFYELERRAKKLPWGNFLSGGAAVRVRVTCRKSKLYHSDAVGERVLSAIVGSVSGSINAEPAEPDDETLESDGNSQLFVVRIVNDECEISVDSSGDLLHRRGYRKEVAKAPLRETIAAAMVLASGWKRGDQLLDPMCGSGTIPIEAALLARKLAPGLKREFQFMGWPGFERERWNELLEAARVAAIALPGELLGSDRDAGAIQAATHNAERAGVGDNARFFQEAVSGSIEGIDAAARQTGWVLTNPPYGVRVGEAGDLRNLYAKLGSMLGEKAGWRLGVLTADLDLVRQTKLPLRARFSTSNGGIPVTFFASEKS
jgi:putative N6-adenine-specific DNA methylase